MYNHKNIYRIIIFLHYVTAIMCLNVERGWSVSFKGSATSLHELNPEIVWESDKSVAVRSALYLEPKVGYGFQLYCSFIHLSQSVCL